LRSLIQTYIVHMDWGSNTLTPRILDNDQFLLPTIQEVIQQTLDTVEQFKRDHPAESVTLGLSLDWGLPRIAYLVESRYTACHPTSVRLLSGPGERVGP
jgi:hypothetical protein